MVKEIEFCVLEFKKNILEGGMKVVSHSAY